MNKYELVVLVDAALPQAEKEAVVKEASEAITKVGGQVISNQVLLEKHKMSFRLKKVTEGTYYLINFEAPGAEVAKLRQALQLNERVLRFLITVGTKA